MKKRIIVIPLFGALAGVFLVMVAIECMEYLRQFSRHNPIAYKHVCIANIKMIDGATATWAQENKKAKSDIPTATDLYGATAYIRDEPLCPEGGKYVIGSVRQKPRCSIPGHTL